MMHLNATAPGRAGDAPCGSAVNAVPLVVNDSILGTTPVSYRGVPACALEDASCNALSGGALAAGKFDGVHDFVATGVWGAGGPSGRQSGQVIVSPAGDLGTAALTLSGPGMLWVVCVLRRDSAQRVACRAQGVYGRFGWSLATLDFNTDGVDDLAVGALNAGYSDWNVDVIAWQPGACSSCCCVARYPHGTARGAGPEFRYYGAVYIYFGHVGTGLSASPDYTVNGAPTQAADAA